MAKLSVLHIISGLGCGGAENMLLRLVKNHQSKQIKSLVVSLTPLSAVGEEFESLGIKVIYLRGISGRLQSVKFFRNLFNIVQTHRPDVIQGWMYHGNLAASLCGIFAVRDIPIVWNVRQSLQSLARERFLTQIVILLCVPLSFGVFKIIYNSRLAATQHERLGYSKKRATFVPNGFFAVRKRIIDRDKSHPLVDIEKSAHPARVVLGHAGRHHPKKGHDVLFDALNYVLELGWDVVLVCVGSNVKIGNSALEEVIPKSVDEKRYFLLGEQKDMGRFYSGLDIFISSSRWGEGFPNVVAEAMSYQLPCVATDVGETRSLLGGSGVLVRNNSAEALAEGIIDLLRMSNGERAKLGSQAQKRVEVRYGMEKIGEIYHQIYLESIRCPKAG